MAEMVDPEKERQRLNKEKEVLEAEIVRLTKKLDNAGFVAKAPAAVVEGEREKLRKASAALEGIVKALSKF